MVFGVLWGFRVLWVFRVLGFWGLGFLGFLGLLQQPGSKKCF